MPQLIYCVTLTPLLLAIKQLLTSNIIHLQITTIIIYNKITGHCLLNYN